MKTSLKTKWLEILEANLDHRAEGTLCDGKGDMCCLGWLLVAAGEVKDPKDKEEVISVLEKYDPENSYRKETDHLQVSFFPYHLHEKLGLSAEEATGLAIINDEEGRFPLEEIRAMETEE